MKIWVEGNLLNSGSVWNRLERGVGKSVLNTETATESGGYKTRNPSISATAVGS